MNDGREFRMRFFGGSYKTSFWYFLAQILIRKQWLEVEAIRKERKRARLAAEREAAMHAESPESDPETTVDCDIESVSSLDLDDEDEPSSPTLSIPPSPSLPPSPPSPPSPKFRERRRGLVPPRLTPATTRPRHTPSVRSYLPNPNAVAIARNAASSTEVHGPRASFSRQGPVAVTQKLASGTRSDGLREATSWDAQPQSQPPSQMAVLSQGKPPSQTRTANQGSVPPQAWSTSETHEQNLPEDHATPKLTHALAQWNPEQPILRSPAPSSSCSNMPKRRGGQHVQVPIMPPVPSFPADLTTANNGGRQTAPASAASYFINHHPGQPYIYPAPYEHVNPFCPMPWTRQEAGSRPPAPSAQQHVFYVAAAPCLAPTPAHPQPREYGYASGHHAHPRSQIPGHASSNRNSQVYFQGNGNGYGSGPNNAQSRRGSASATQQIRYSAQETRPSYPPHYAYTYPYTYPYPYAHAHANANAHATALTNPYQNQHQYECSYPPP